MLRLNAIQAKPGMTLAMPVYHPAQPSTILLRAGAVLQERTIAALYELGVGELWIEYPHLEQVADCISEEVIQARAETMQVLSDAFDAMRPDVGAELDYRAFRRAIVDLVNALMNNPDAALLVQDMYGCEHPLLQHAANVAYISLLIGLKIDFYLEHQRPRLEPAHARDVSSLGLGAVLHDVGVLKLDEDVVEQYLASGDEYEQRFRQHVKLGYDMVRGQIDPTAASIVLHHHQRFDGSGYPGRKTGAGVHTPAGTDIHVFARIVAAADLFDALRFPPRPPGQPPAPPMPTVRALKRMSEPPISDWIDPVIYLGLLAVVPPYPPGTTVELSNGIKGVVTRWHPDEPCRPVVREIPGLGDKIDAPPGEECNLKDHPELCVVVAHGHDVRNDNFYSSEEVPFDLHGVARALINRAAGPIGKSAKPTDPSSGLAQAG